MPPLSGGSLLWYDVPPGNRADTRARVIMTIKRNHVVSLLAVLLVLLAIGWYVVPRIMGPRQRARRIILISIDTCRADYVGCYDPARETTPNIDAFAQQVTLFENARAAVPITLPSHATMLTGLTPPFHRVRSQPYFQLSPNVPTLATILKGRGYSTGAIVSSVVLDPGFPRWTLQF